MPVVGIAEVLVKPIFSGTQRAISKEMGPAASKAGRDAGSKMGKGMAAGFSAETAGLEAEVGRLGKVVSQAENSVAASKTKMADASAAESKALGELRVAELKLQEIRENSQAKASQVAAAEEKLEVIRGRAAAATSRRESAERNLTSATTSLGNAQRDSAKASADLETHMRRVADESANTERGVGRLSTMLNSAFRGNPLARMVTSMRGDGDRIRLDLHKLSQDVSKEGTRGGRAFTQAFIGVMGGLSAITPTAGAAGAAVLAASGNVITFAASLSSLAGVAALVPAGLMAIGAGAGVLVTAFAGVGDALKTALDAGKSMTAANPRLAAMAVEDAMMAITVAEENAAQAQEDAARRVSDAKRSLQDTIAAVAEAEKSAADAQVAAARRVQDAKLSLQDTIENVAEAQRDAARSVELAERREAEAARDVVKAQKELVEAREKAAARVAEVGKKLSDANLKATDTTLNLQRATEAYNKAKADPAVGAMQLAQLQNNMAKAAAADEEAKQAVLDLRGEQKEASAEAKAGNAAVLAAEEKLAKARQDQEDAIYARKEAEEDAVKRQKEGARQVQDAQQAVTDAIQDQKTAHADVAKAAQEGARRISDAQQAVADATRDSQRAEVEAARSLQQAHRNLERVQMQQADAAAQSGQKSAEAMGQLTPAAQESVRALLTVKDMLGGIRRIAQENFFKGFSAPLLSLANSVMPQLATGVGAIASALGAGAQIFMGAVESALGNGVLESLLLGVAKTTEILNTAITPVVEAFTTLGVVGMDYMPRLAQAVSDVAKWFNDLVQKSAADGSLKAWIDGGIQGFKDLWSIGGSIVGIFDSLNKAAEAGGAVSTLGGMASGLREIDAAMQGEVFQTTMATLFSGAAAGAEGLKKALGPIADAFVRGAPAMAEFLRLGGEIAGTFLGGVFTALSNPEFGSGLVTFMEGLQRGVADIAPLLPGLTGAFGGLLTALAPIAERLGPSLIEVFTFFAESIANVLTFLLPMLTAIADSPVLLGLMIGAFTATAAASAALTAAGNVQRIAMGLWRGAVLLVTGAQKALNLVLKANPIGLVITAIGLLVGALVWLYSNNEDARRIMDAAWLGIRTAIQWAWQNVIKPTFDAIVGFVRDVLAPLFDWLWKTIVKPSFDGIGAAVKWVWENVLRPVFRTLGDFITKTIPDAFKKGVGFIKTHWDTLKKIASAPVAFVVNTIIRDGLIGTFNKVADILPGIERIDPPPEFKGFARGGILPGQSSWRNGDDQLVPMRKGEGVYVSEVMNDPYERARLYTMNKAAIMGRTAREARALLGEGLAKGGIVNPLRSMAQTQGYNRIHKGIDLAASVGTPVYATENGRVSWSGPGVQAPGVWGGNEVHIDGGSGIQTWFAHLSSMAVRVGQMVRAGQQIAKSGNTGISSGPHLHFGTFDGGWPNDINPYTYLTGAAQPSGKDSGGFDPLGMFTGLGDKIVGQIKNAFPAAGFMIDAVTGIGKKLFGNVVDWVKGKLGFGSATGTAPTGAHQGPNLYDNGGVLNPGLSTILNATRKPEAIYTFEQNRALQTLAARGAASSAGTQVNINGNVGWDPSRVAQEIEVHKRRAQTMAGMSGVVFA